MNIKSSDILDSGSSSEGFEINNQLGIPHVFYDVTVNKTGIEETGARGLNVVIDNTTHDYPIPVNTAPPNAMPAIDLQTMLNIRRD